MYTLYVRKEKMIIEVKKAGKGMSHCKYTDDVVRYNDCYFTCLKRKPLVEKAKEIKESWVSELEEKLEKVKSIEF